MIVILLSIYLSVTFGENNNILKSGKNYYTLIIMLNTRTLSNIFSNVKKFYYKDTQIVISNVELIY